MQLKVFYYNLPPELIAKYPAEPRTSSRLLCLDRATGGIVHKRFCDLVGALNPNDLLVFNNSKVIPARLFGKKHTGGKVEILVERILKGQRILAHVRSSKSPKPDSLIILDENIRVKVLSRQNDLFVLQFLTDEKILNVLERIGHIPLPPYIDRADEMIDKERYQTVYAKQEGSVAAPTAGLHFDEKLMSRIMQRGVEIGYLTLHVGAGTFLPVRVKNIKQHKMHSEIIDVPEKLVSQIKHAKEQGGRVIAVGTTSVRSLEAASRGGAIKPYCGETDIFIYPGYKFKCIDAMITNFHLPESTLLMLVCAFAGKDNIMKAYAEAVREKYRFYSYGDAMFLI